METVLVHQQTGARITLRVNGADYQRTDSGTLDYAHTYPDASVARDKARADRAWYLSHGYYAPTHARPVSAGAVALALA